MQKESQQLNPEETEKSTLVSSLLLALNQDKTLIRNVLVRYER